jgi:hypothetical protein
LGTAFTLNSEAMQQKVLDPLGMTRSTGDVDIDGKLVVSGSDAIGENS